MIKWRCVTAIMTALVVSACFDATGPDAAVGTFVMTSLDNNDVPYVRDFGDSRRTELADTLYLRADGSAEWTTTFKLEGPQYPGSPVNTWRSTYTYDSDQKDFELVTTTPLDTFRDCDCMWWRHTVRVIPGGLTLTSLPSNGQPTVYRRYLRVE